MISSMSVQEYRLGKWLSIQTPSAIPSSVGRATDQPTKPSIPRPNQMLLDLPHCALSLRLSLRPTWRMKKVRYDPDFTLRRSSMLELQESSRESALQLGERRTDTPFSLIEIQKLLLDGFSKLPQVRTAGGVADREDHFRAGFHQH